MNRIIQLIQSAQNQSCITWWSKIQNKDFSYFSENKDSTFCLKKNKFFLNSFARKLNLMKKLNILNIDISSCIGIHILSGEEGQA